MLNPIEKRIAAGMNPLVAFLTEATCGEACWEAREDICRCSCGGENHGCMRDTTGKRPERTAKIDGYRYVLKAADVSGIYAQARKINDAAGPYRVEPYTAIDYHEDGTQTKVAKEYRYFYTETMKGAPARRKPATREQIARWPELAAWRDDLRSKPYLLWVREDLVPKSNPTTETDMPKTNTAAKSATKKTAKAKAKTKKTSKSKVVSFDRSAAAKKAWETMRAAGKGVKKAA